jgi:potassium channel subfamily K, other eukaryote
VAIQFATVVTDAFSSKYHSVTHDKSFDRAVRRYRQDQEKVTLRKADENGDLRSGRSSSQVVPALQANLARISSGGPVPSDLVPPQPTRTLAEAEDRLRTRIEPLPAIILKEVYRLRDHTRYFLLTNGHADVLGRQVGGASLTPRPDECAAPENLKQLLDEVAQEEGFEERLKQEVWDNPHARNVSVLEYG